jgi:sarcosine oxidase gamma subunit
MLSEGRIPTAENEHTAVEKLLAEHAGESASLTREGETLLVQIGPDVWEISSDGKRKKQRAG